MEPALGARRSLELLRPSEIQALEIYPDAAGIPSQAAGFVSPCGASVVWSKH